MEKRQYSIQHHNPQLLFHSAENASLPPRATLPSARFPVGELQFAIRDDFRGRSDRVGVAEDPFFGSYMSHLSDMIYPSISALIRGDCKLR
jgi:hypothetical protein